MTLSFADNARPVGPPYCPGSPVVRLTAVGDLSSEVTVQLARVLGQVVSTVKEPALGRHTLLLLADAGDGEGSSDEPAYVAVDLVGAGVGEVVLVSSGGAARVAAGPEVPVDRAVVAIADSVIRAGVVTYSKS